MVDYSAFDSLLDSVFIVDTTGHIVYCNDAAASFSQISIRRLVGKANINQLIRLSVAGILPFNEQSTGRHEPTSFIETEFELIKPARKGKAQLAVRPLNGEHWGFFIRDVSLEEALYLKFRAELAQKEEYARNLEKLVEARTAELRAVNQTLNAILNSLGQGFFTFDAQGQCGQVFTKACESVLEGSPRDRRVWDFLAIQSEELDQFRKWVDLMFQELLPFDDVKILGPGVYRHSGGRHVVLDFYPIRADQHSISEVVVVATDRTAEREAQNALMAEREFAAMVVKFIKSKDQFRKFLQSAREALFKLSELAQAGLSSSSINESLRLLHTLEGEAGTFSLRGLWEDARQAQQVLTSTKAALKVDSASASQYLAALKNMANRFEGFLEQNRQIFGLSADGSSSKEISIEKILALASELQKSGISPHLQQRLRELIFKVPVSQSFAHFDGLIQNVAENLGKRIRPLAIVGGEILIFPEPYQNLFSSFVHAFRNAVDHGLETVEEREWAGKSPEGSIGVEFSRREGWLEIKLHDDGRGIDPTVIRAKLREKFPDRDFLSQSDQEIIQNICLPGFSSRDSVGEYSGRGVGLDALREEVIRLGGHLRVKSVIGQGTVIEIEVPDLEMPDRSLRSA